MEGKSNSKNRGVVEQRETSSMDVIVGEWQWCGVWENCPRSGIWQGGEIRVVAYGMVGRKVHDKLCWSCRVDMDICRFLVLEKR